MHFGLRYYLVVSRRGLDADQPRTPRRVGGGDGGETRGSVSHCHRLTQIPSPTNPRQTIRRTVLACGKYNKLEQKNAALIVPICLSPVLVHALFDFFLPRPSLSTTSSLHTTRGRLRGPPRRRRVPVGPGPAAVSETSPCSASCTATTTCEPSRSGLWDKEVMLRGG
jgi:hypothetical protein